VGRDLHRLLRAESKAERDAIDRVATKFFTADAAGLVNARALEEIRKGAAQREINRELGKRGGRPRKTDHETDSVSGSVNESKTNHNPNQTPDTIKGKDKEKKRAPRVRAVCCPDGVPAQVWDDWLALRREKRATVTQTVLDSAAAEARKAGVTIAEFLRIWCLRGSQGLQAEWIKPDEIRGARQQSPEPAWRAEERRRMQQAVPGIAERSPNDPITIDAELSHATPQALD
jgi:uncharacterized protein YdaU (DUF1376 family)